MLTGPRETKDRARALRRRMSPPELVLWKALRASPGGLRFRRRHPAGPYILDFYCHGARLAVEVDGARYGTDAARRRDEQRDGFLSERGVAVVRVAAREVAADLDGVLEQIVGVALSRSAGTPSTASRSPSPKGEEGAAPPRPGSGRFDANGVHRFAVRVYFEDTDLAGIVYHANYLRFLERARSEMLRLAGIDQLGVFEAGEGTYAVAHLDIRYKRSARLDDVLVVESRVRRVRGAAAEIAQTILREGELVVEALVTAALVGPDGRPRRQPREWRETFEKLRGQGDDAG